MTISFLKSIFFLYLVLIFDFLLHQHRKDVMQRITRPNQWKDVMSNLFVIKTYIIEIPQ